MSINLIKILFLELTDFIALSDILCFPPTSTELTTEVAIVADDVPECAEIFIVQLTLGNNTVEVNLGRSFATVTITEDQGALCTLLFSQWLSSLQYSAVLY